MPTSHVDSPLVDAMKAGGETNPLHLGAFIHGGGVSGDSVSEVAYGSNGAIARDERDGGIIKFHVGDPGSARRADLVRELIPTLRRLGVEYKVMSNLWSDSPTLSGSQKGKFITVYPPAVERAADVERQLGAVMNRFARKHEAGGLGYASPPFDYATPYPGLHWRFGGFQSHDVSGPTQRRGMDATSIPDDRDSTSAGMLASRLHSERTVLSAMLNDPLQSPAAIKAKSERVGALDTWMARARQNPDGSTSIDPPTVRRPTIRPGESADDRRSRVSEAIGAGQAGYWRDVVASQTAAAQARAGEVRGYRAMMNTPEAPSGPPAAVPVGPSVR